MPRVAWATSAAKVSFAKEVSEIIAIERRTKSELIGGGKCKDMQKVERQNTKKN